MFKWTAGERRGRPKQGNEQQGELVEPELPQNFAEVAGKETRQVAAEKAGFGNAETYRQAKTVTEKAAPELVEAVDQGAPPRARADRLSTRFAPLLIVSNRFQSGVP